MTLKKHEMTVSNRLAMKVIGPIYLLFALLASLLAYIKWRENLHFSAYLWGLFAYIGYGFCYNWRKEDFPVFIFHQNKLEIKRGKKVEKFNSSDLLPIVEIDKHKAAFPTTSGEKIEFYKNHYNYLQLKKDFEDFIESGDQNLMK